MSDRIALVRNVAVSAVGAGEGGVACAYAIGLNGHRLIAVSLGSNYRLINGNLAADGASLSVGKSRGGTSRICAGYNSLSVSERRGLIGNVAVTAEACVSGISRLFTGGCGYCRTVAVSFSRDNLLRYKNVSADRALLTLGETCLGTGRRLSGNDLFIVVGAKVLATYVTGVILIVIGVSLCGDHILLYGSLSTHGTYLTVSKTCFCTCSRRAGYQSLGVTERRCVICCVAVSANGAGVGGVAAVFTGGRGYCRLVAMLLYLDLFLFKKHFTADGALLTLGKTCFGTSRCLAGNSYYVMIGAEVLAAYVTGVILIRIGVSLCGDHILLYGGHAAHGTYLTVSKTVLGACSRLAGYRSLGVTEGRLIIRCVAVSASGACVGSIA